MIVWVFTKLPFKDSAINRVLADMWFAAMFLQLTPWKKLADNVAMIWIISCYANSFTNISAYEGAKAKEEAEEGGNDVH